MAIFPPFFVGNIGQENVFYDILERKSTFLGDKNKKFKKSNNWHFSARGVNHGFGPKIGIFPTFFLGIIGQENVFYDILQRKNAFLGYKNKKFKQSNREHVTKGVNSWFFSKMAICETFFYIKYRPGKCPLRYSRTKKRLCRL